MKNIAIDGPAGAGKTSISKILSKELNIMYVDTGAMYRSIAYFIKEKDIKVEESLDFYNLLKKEINVEFIEDKTILNKEDISKLIRTEEISQLASIYSKNKYIREFLTYKQKDLANKNDVIMEGRDITTVVLPESKCKIYLDASLEERTIRRLLQQNKNINNKEIYDEIYKELKERDYRDSHRDIAPLKIAIDAKYIDSTKMNIEEVKNEIKNYFYETNNK